MTARRAKQAIYGALFLVIIMAIAAGVWLAFFRTAASCFDGVENQGETGIDCGGPCVAVCLPQGFQPVTTVGAVRVFNPYPYLSSLPQHYTFLAQVADPNAGLGLERLDYAFNLYDASGSLIQSVPGQSFIYPGEVKYLAVPNIAVDAVVDRASLAIAPVATSSWMPAASMGLAPQFGNPLPITGSALTSSTAAGAAGTVTVTGRLTDSDASAFTNILIVAVFYDSYGNPIGASQTVLDSISPDQTETFSVTYPAAPGLAPALTKAYAYALR